MKVMTFRMVAFFSLMAPGFLLAQDPDNLEAKLKQFLERFPESDLNEDGTLTREEVRQFNQKRRGQKGQASTGQRPGRPEPTHADVSYGAHEKQRFDLWLVEGAEEPTPLAIFIHGGGFRGGDKRSFPVHAVRKFREEGIAFASMNYRLSDVGPYPIMMDDAARGLQTLRHGAKTWNLDASRVVCYGGSAGAGISLWLAFREDLADPESEDPVAGQSTRLLAAGTTGGQSTYDMRTIREWFGVPNLKPHDALIPFYGVKEGGDWESERVIRLMEDASPIQHLTRDDVPVYMTYGQGDVPVDETTSQGTWVHHVKLGLKLQEAMNELGLECVVRSPDHPDEQYGSLEDFLIAKLRAE